MRVPRPQDPPETGMRIVGGIIRSGQAVNPGAAFGGLLCLGDRRAHPWLLDIRDQLSVAEIEQAVRIRTGFLSAATVEFYLGWMEERQRDADGRVFGALAAGLVNQVVASKVPMIMTGLRTIPPGRVPEDQETKVAAWVPLEGYAEQIAPRLLALDAAEREPKVMPEVLRAWGIAGQG